MGSTPRVACGAMRKRRPINAEVPAGDSPAGASSAGEEPKKPAAKPAPAGPPPAPGGGRSPKSKVSRPRRPLPLPLKLVGLAVLAAVIFIVAAILGGRGEEGSQAPAPAVGGASRAGSNQSPASQAAEELGYPAFATRNTTRVGGAEPAANAAAVALATFPSAEDAQRPSAVSLVDESDWAAAIAAAVLAGPPVRAPLLLGSAQGLSDSTDQALAALAPQGRKETRGVQLIAIGDLPPPHGLKAVAAHGGSPAAVAASVARLRDRLFGSPPRHLVIAPLDDPSFAMPAAAWAARSGDPVLFSAERKLPAPTVAALKRHPKTPVFVLGPPSAIAKGVLREISKLGPKVRRVAGRDAVENAIALARYASGDFGWNVNDPGHGFVIARSDSPLDAAAAAPLSASGTWGPLLLTDDADTLPTALRSYLLDVKPGYTEDPTRAFYNHVWIIGDLEAIDMKEQAEIDSLAELAKIGGEP